MAETTTETTEMDPRVAAEEEEAERWAHEELPERQIDYERIKRFVIKRDGKDFIQFLGLIDLLHQESGGRFTITTRLEQAPTDENKQTAIVSAMVTLRGDDGEPVREAAGLGDANPANVSRAMAPHLIRMAETRGKARALRDLLNVGMVAAEELGPDGPAPGFAHDEPRAAGNGAPAQAPAVNPNQDGITLEGRWYTRDQVWGFYQQRASQCRDRGLPIPQPMLNRNVPLQTIVDKTQEMKRTLAQAGALAPAGDQGRP